MAYTAKYSSDTGAGANDGSSEANAWTWAQMVSAIVALGAGGGAGLHVKHKSNGGTARTTNTDALSVGGSATSPLIIEGYLSTPGAAGSAGDGYLGRTNNHCCGGGLIDTNMPSIVYTTGRFNNTATFTAFLNLKISAANVTQTLTLSANNIARGCILIHSGTDANAIALSHAATALSLDCDASLTGASGGSCAVSLQNAGCECIGSRITGGQSVGVKMQSTSHLGHSLVYGCTGFAVSMMAMAGTPVIHGNTIAKNSSDGINIITGATSLQRITDNLITDNGGHGINGVSAANAVFDPSNRFRDNTLGNTNLATDWMTLGSIVGIVTTDTGGPETDYVGYASNDFRLINGSPAQDMIYGHAAGAYQFSPVAIPVGHGCMG